MVDIKNRKVLYYSKFQNILRLKGTLLYTWNFMFICDGIAGDSQQSRTISSNCHKTRVRYMFFKSEPLVDFCYIPRQRCDDLTLLVLCALKIRLKLPENMYICTCNVTIERALYFRRRRKCMCVSNEVFLLQCSSHVCPKAGPRCMELTTPALYSSRFVRRHWIYEL